jgi:APA family basic amino acid/polyamine antiporter
VEELNSNMQGQRQFGLMGTIGVGVGAIVGGGILALAGVAFASTGPAAIIAFALNGLIALITALSFAELSTTFPESGGTYTFAKKIVSVEAAFAVGWVIWFASIVAAVLYAIGFASFAVILIDNLWEWLIGPSPPWTTGGAMVTVIALSATIFYSYLLIRRGASGGQWANIGKVLVFAVLIVGGFLAFDRQPTGEMISRLQPFLPYGILGLIQAMGYTFIALQGFDLIAAIGGEVREPQKTIPRAMLVSLIIALAIYLPLLLFIATVGIKPGQSIVTLSSKNPEAIVAIAAQNYLGRFGYWLVIFAGILSMLSALYANLLASSRIAFTMARDRTLPHALGVANATHGTPLTAIVTTTIITAVIVIIIPNVAVAGAAASLVFLISFAIAHWISISARRRGDPSQRHFRTPWFPSVPIIGLVTCISLAVFQGIEVPLAGLIISIVLGIGGILFLVIFARRARIVDALTQAIDPQLARLRGRNPLVLVPIANPSNAEAMVKLANALAPPNFGRVLLLSVVSVPAEWDPENLPKQLVDTQAVLREALTASFSAGLAPEALTTVSPRPWSEIIRVSRIHRCQSLLLGLSNLDEDFTEKNLEELMSSVDSDVVILRAPQGWRLSEVNKILVPIGGRGDHDEVRARLLGSLYRTGARAITFIRVLPENTSQEESDRALKNLDKLANDEVPGVPKVKIALNNNVIKEITKNAAESDLVIVGLQRLARRRKKFGKLTLQIARETSCPLIMISRSG